MSCWGHAMAEVSLVINVSVLKPRTVSVVFYTTETVLGFSTETVGQLGRFLDVFT
jgi:hypothetical protein